MENCHLEHLFRVWSLYRNNSTNNTDKILERRTLYDITGYDSDYLLPKKEKYKTYLFLKTCQWCMITWREGMKTVYIEPEKRQSKDNRYLCRKFSGSYNKYQRKIVKKYEKERKCNYLVVVCHLCRKKSKLLLRKTKSEDNNKLQTPTNTEMETIPEKVKKSKRKNKQNIFRGLNPKAVMRFHNSLSEENQSNEGKRDSGGTSSFIKVGKKEIKKLLKNGEERNKKKEKQQPALSQFFDVVFD